MPAARDLIEPKATAAAVATLTLPEEFYQECINHPVPIDLRVLHKLRSPLADDIYNSIQAAVAKR